MSRTSKRLRYLMKKFRQGKLKRKGRRVKTKTEVYRMAVGRR